MKYFRLEEFKCKCGRCEGYPEYGMSEVLLEKLDKLREMVGAPIYVSSGWRCYTHNANVGGVWNSQHRYGTAADLVCSAVSVERLAELAREVGFDGIGEYPYSGFVHVDCRDDGGSPAYYQWKE